MSTRMRWDKLELQRRDARGRREAVQGVRVERKDTAAPPRTREPWYRDLHVTDRKRYERADLVLAELEEYAGADGRLLNMLREYELDPQWLPTEGQAKVIRGVMSATDASSPGGS